MAPERARGLSGELALRLRARGRAMGPGRRRARRRGPGTGTRGTVGREEGTRLCGGGGPGSSSEGGSQQKKARSFGSPPGPPRLPCREWAGGWGAEKQKPGLERQAVAGEVTVAGIGGIAADSEDLSAGCKF